LFPFGYQHSQLISSEVASSEATAFATQNLDTLFAEYYVTGFEAQALVNPQTSFIK